MSEAFDGACFECSEAFMKANEFHIELIHGTYLYGLFIEIFMILMVVIDPFTSPFLEINDFTADCAFGQCRLEKL